MSEDLFSPIQSIDIKSQKDIDNAVKKHPSFQRDYVWMAIRQDIRDEINKRWDVAKKFSEKDFIREFQTKDRFYSRLWELNLRYLLHTKLSRAPGSGEPDLIGSAFVVECVVPMPTDVPDLKLDGKLYDYPSDEIARRVTAALTAKLAQLDSRRASRQSTIDYTKTPYIIAICLPERNYMSALGKSGLDIVEEVLMGAGPIQITIDSTNNTATASVSSRGAIQSRNNSNIDIAYFQRDEYKPVSAVIWSNEYLPDINQIKLIINPNASIHFNPKELSIISNLITYSRTSTGYTRDQKI